MCGFPAGSLRFGAVNGTEPHRRVCDLFKTEPHRIVGFLISENRTEQHRRIRENTEPHGVAFTIFENRTEPHRRNAIETAPHRVHQAKNR